MKAHVRGRLQEEAIEPQPLIAELTFQRVSQVSGIELNKRWKKSGVKGYGRRSRE